MGELKKLEVVLIGVALIVNSGSLPAAAAPLTQCTPGYHAEYVSVVPAGQIAANPGEAKTVTITLRNLGCETWNRGTASEVNLGTWNPEPGQDKSSDLCYVGAAGWNGCNRIRQSTTSVAYNATADFTFSIRGPYINNMYPEGIFTVYVRPVSDGAGVWLEDLGMWVQLKIGNYYGVKNTSFKRPFVAPQQTINLMDQQATCLYCVPASTTAWISYVWQKVNGNDSGHYFTHQDFWDNYFGVTSKTYSGWNTSENAPACASRYNRRLINSSLDDGVDPYGAAWGIFDYTPGGYYYHVNVYWDGANATGYDYGTRGIGLALSRYDEPVGVLIGNGGHYVLATGVISNVDPNVNFWGAVITKVYVRDPWLSATAQLQAFATGLPSPWADNFNKYGYLNNAPRNPPQCPNCVDETHGFGSWWGANVTVERNPQSGTNDTPDQIKRYQN